MTLRKLCATTALMTIAAGTVHGYSSPGAEDTGFGQKISVKLDSNPRVALAPKLLPHRAVSVLHEINAPDGKSTVRVPGIKMGNLTYVLNNLDRSGNQLGVQLPTQQTHGWQQDQWGRWQQTAFNENDLTAFKPGTAIGDALNALYHTSKMFDTVHSRLRSVVNKITKAGGAVPERLAHVLKHWGEEHILIGADFMEEMNAFFALNGPLKSQKELIMCKFMNPQTGQVFRTVGDVNVLDHEAGHGVFALLFPELFGTIENEGTSEQKFIPNTVVEGGILEGGADIMVLLRMMTDPAILEQWQNETGGITDVSSFVTQSGELFAKAIGMEVGYFRDAESGKKVLSREEQNFGSFSLDDRHNAIGTGNKVHGIGESLVSPIWDIWEWTFNAHRAVHKDAGVSLFDSAKTTAEAIFGNMFFEALFTTDQASDVQADAKLSRIGTRVHQLAAGYEELLGISGLAEAGIDNDLVRVNGIDHVPTFAEVIEAHFNAHNIGVGRVVIGADQEDESNRFFTAHRGGGVGYHQCDRLEHKVEQANESYKVQHSGQDHQAFFNMRNLKNAARKATKVADGIQTGLHIGGQLAGGNTGSRMNRWNQRISDGRNTVRAGHNIFNGLFGGGYASEMPEASAYGAPHAHSATGAPVYHANGYGSAEFFNWGRAKSRAKSARRHARNGLDMVDQGLDVYGRHGSVFGLPHANRAHHAQVALRHTRHEAEKMAQDAEDFARRTRRAVDDARDGSRSARTFLNGLFGSYGGQIAGYGGHFGVAQTSARSAAPTGSAHSAAQSTCPGGVCPMPTQPSPGYPQGGYSTQGLGQARWG